MVKYWYTSWQGEGTMLTMEDLLTPEDVARILRMTEYTVREKLKNGEIQGFKLGGRWKVRPEALRKYIEQQEQK
jgi:excisionase family DNA binding protein